jgi:hypothetical protein
VAALCEAADLMLGLNQSAGTLLHAVAAGLPAVVVVNSAGGSADEVAAALGHPPSADLRAWLDGAAPLHPFRVWPLGLHRFLAPVLRGNPYERALRTVELLDEEGLLSACRALLHDAAARADARAEQARYRTLAARRPTPAEAFLERHRAGPARAQNSV